MLQNENIYVSKISNRIFWFQSHILFYKREIIAHVFGAVHTIEKKLITQLCIWQQILALEYCLKNQNFS